MRWFSIRSAFMLAAAVSWVSARPLPAAAEHAHRKPVVSAHDRAIPRFKHIFVIVGENKDSWRVNGGASAPTFTWLARTFGDATRFYGEVHPSEANYAALIGGSTLGIHDDDAFYCVPGMIDTYCPHSGEPGYVAHQSNGMHLGNQLDAIGLTWKGYYQGIPSNGSLDVIGTAAGDTASPERYASKHSGFLNFASVSKDPRRAQHLVGFQRLKQDLANNTAPNFALVVPDLCDDMHGMPAGPGVPASCQYDHLPELIGRGDAMMKLLYNEITSSALWRESANSAIVVTFDEDDGTGRQGCCGITPAAASNFGGGHIATMVITNHHHRHIVDGTPYNHYSLLRTLEDAYGIHTYLGNANEYAKGVRPMYPLFALQ